MALKIPLNYETNSRNLSNSVAYFNIPPFHTTKSHAEKRFKKKQTTAPAVVDALAWHTFMIFAYRYIV